MKCKICGCDSDEEHLDDTIDFDNTYKNIMKEEEGKQSNSHIYVNLSTGSKVSSLLELLHA